MMTHLGFNFSHFFILFDLFIVVFIIITIFFEDMVSTDVDWTLSFGQGQKKWWFD